MKHQDLTYNHRLENWVYANEAARIGATVVATDVGRVAFQTDTQAYWRLVNHSPVTWWPIPPDAAVFFTTVAALSALPYTLHGGTARTLIVAVTDGAASLAWGATISGGGSTKYLVWWNGANWTVIGK